MAQRQINILRNYLGIIDRYAIIVMGYGKVSQYGLRIYMSSIFKYSKSINRQETVIKLVIFLHHHACLYILIVEIPNSGLITI